MKGSKPLLLSLAALGLFACQDGGPDSADCNGGKCDDFGASSFGQLMPRAPAAPGTISVARNRDRWLFEVIGDKGEIILLSQEYGEQAAAFNGVLGVEENGVLPERYVVRQAGGSWSFALRAGNGEEIAESQIFASEAEAREAADQARALVAGIVQYKAAMRDGAQFELRRDGSSWSFALLSEDGQELLTSQSYTRRSDAITGIESVRQNGKDGARYQVVASPPGFILKAANGRTIAASSSTYESTTAAEAAISSTQALLTSERVANPW